MCVASGCQARDELGRGVGPNRNVSSPTPIHTKRELLSGSTEWREESLLRLLGGTEWREECLVRMPRAVRAEAVRPDGAPAGSSAAANNEP